MSTTGWETPHKPKSIGRRAVRAAAILAAVALASTATRAADVLSTWKGNSSGNWSDPTKWNNMPAAAAFPDNGNLGNTYDAVFGAGGTQAMLDRVVNLRNLTMSGGSVVTNHISSPASPGYGTNTLTAAGTFTFGGGTVAAPVRIPVGASLFFSSPGAEKTVGSLQVDGTASFAPNVGTHVLRARGIAQIEIGPTGTFNLSRPLSLVIPNAGPSEPENGGSVRNYGLVDQAAGANFKSAWALLNYGTFVANARVDIDRYESYGALLDLRSASAVFSPANVNFASGGVRLAPGAVFDVRDGSTSVPHEFGAFAVTNAGAINLAGTAHFAAPITLPGAVNLTGSGVSTLTLDAEVTLTGPATFSAYELRGAGRLRAMNLSYTSGRIDGGELNIPVGGNATISGDVTMLGDALLTVDGTANWNAGGARTLGGTARFEIRPGGVTYVRPSATAKLTGGPYGTVRATFANAGLLDLDHTPFSITHGWTVNNTGTIRAAGGSHIWGAFATDVAGVLELSDGVTFQTTGSQSMSVAPTGRWSIASGAYANMGSIDFTNAGTFEIEGRSSRASFGIGIVNSGALRVIAGGAIDFNSTSGPATNSGSIDVTTGATANFNGGLHLSGPAATLRVAGGTATVSAYSFMYGGLSNAGRVVVESGGRFQVGASSLNSGAIHVRSGSAATFNRFTNAGSVVLDDAGTAGSFTYFANLAGGTVRVSGGAVMTVNVSEFNNNGTIDLSAGGALVGIPLDRHQAFNQMRAQIISGYVGGAWTGTGISSLDARLDPTTAVGYATASNVAAATLAWLGDFSNSGHVILRHTKYGDTTLDGLVDFTDLVRLAQNYNATNRAWSDGDFTYDGVVDFNDLVKLAQNYNSALPPTAVPGAPPSFQADLARAFATLPEPGALALLAPAACGFAARRRHTRTTYTNS